MSPEAKDTILKALELNIAVNRTRLDQIEHTDYSNGNKELLAGLHKREIEKLETAYREIESN